jgi:dolichyl-phosphooligosaccharide-protein glycotransferase
MESSHVGWWRRHGWTVAILLAAFGISFAIRTIWSYPIVDQWGPLFTYAGGSDSYYHSRVMAYIALNHRNLIHDPMLKFPVGAINPREPLFDWMNGVLGVVFAPAFGGNPVVAGSWFLDLQAPLWAALGVFPVYLIGREVASRRTGLVAALIFPFLSANIDSTIFGYANYLSFYTFVILVCIYSYIRTVKSVGSRRWVESYRHPKSVLAGLRAFLRTERTAVKWAVFTGVSLGALALAWQGFTYAVVVIGISVFVSVIAERIRRVDSFGLYVAAWIVGLVGFPMAVPYYIVQQQFAVWFDLPLLLYFGVLVLLLPFMFLRDTPWVFSLPLTGALVVLAAGLLAIVNPTYFTSIVTGQGYFVKNLIYSTVAEAQAPSIDQLIIGYGVVTFFLAFVGLAIFLYLLVHGRFKRQHVVFLVFAILSIYLPISAAKFFLLGSPIFALLPAEAIVRALDLAGFPELRRTVASLSDRRSQFSAFRKAFKVRHVVILALVIGLVLPNVWIAIDAGIPGNTKAQYSSQVASTLPPWIQPNTSNPSGYYFGAAGSSLDTPNQYDSAGYNWLAQQDTNLPPSQRPAFVSWWDYGFQAIAQGDHPSVADNFQNGIDPAGQFLLAQNESQAIGVLTVTLLQAEVQKSGLTYLPPALNQILARDGLDVATLHSLLANTSDDHRLVVAHPERYLPVNPNTITNDNAMYLATAYYLATSLPLSGVAKVYNDVQSYTGWSIAYAMSDSRLFPFSGTDTGIYYAPADLTGRVINSAGLPTTFFNVTVLGSDGNTYPAGQVPAGVTAVNYTINYFAPFYNSMIYHIFIGYNGTDAGLGPGIPGLEGSTQVIGAPLMPGWMLQHFQVVYRTAYYCAHNNASSGSSCFGATNLPAAVARAKTSGTADTSASAYFSGGETMLQYYPGQPLLGTVALPDGTPVAGARVTVDDGWGIPHMSVLTGADGAFSVILPPGNDTLNVTVGALDGLRQQGSTLLSSTPITVPNAIGLSFNAPTLVRTVTVNSATAQGFVYWNSNNTTSYSPSGDPLIPGARVLLWGPNNLSQLSATTDASGSFRITNIPPGVYNYNILTGGRNYSQGTVSLTPGLVYNATAGLLPGFFTGVVRNATGYPARGATVTLADASGVVGSATTNSTGGYLIRSVGAGNYTLTASGPVGGWRSEGVAVSISSPGATAHTNLTVRPTSLFTLSVSANGQPAAGISVRFTPVAAFNSSTPPIGALLNESGNASVLTSTSSGTVTAALPTGTYAVYALGYVGATLESGVTDVTVGATFARPSGSIALAPAVRLSGTVASAGPISNSTRTAVIAYDPSGNEVAGWADANGSFSFVLPAGTYSVLSLTGGTRTGASQVYVALASVPLSGPTTIALSPVVAVGSEFTVGSTLPNGALFPAAGALVRVTGGTNGPSVSAVVGANGRVMFYVPSVLPLLGTYCVSASAIGFTSTPTCGITPSGMSALTHLPLTLSNVATTLVVNGLPGGSSVTVNLTAESATAQNRTLSGSTSYSLSLPPGVYVVAGYASLGKGKLYLPTAPLATTIPVGATYSNLTLDFLLQAFVKGTLNLPGGASLARVNVTLASSLMDLHVNGSTYTSGFFAAPGTYSAYANVTAAGTTYANLTTVQVNLAGTISGPLDLTQPSVNIVGTLANATGIRVPLTTNVTLTGPGGAAVTTLAGNGSFLLEVTPYVPYSLSASAVGVTNGPNGSFYQSWTNAPGSSCTPTPTEEACVVTMVPTTELVWLNGSLTSAGLPGNLPGSVSLVGPYPSSNVTVVAASNGTFAARILPGAYDVYASAGAGGTTRAAFAGALALPSTSRSLSLSLAPTWTATVQLAPPNGTLAGLGPVTLTVRDANGHRLVYPGLTGSSSVMLALPSGTYTVSANATGTLNGMTSQASAQASVTVGAGNVGVALSLAYNLAPQVTANMVGPSSATVVAGGTATFAFVARNTGNVPLTIVPVGTPAYWVFNFSFFRASLSPGEGTSGEVVVHVPAGTPVNHPAVSIEFETLSGTVVGSVAPAPTITVVGYYGIAVGRASSPVSVGPNQTIVPFYVTNTGNTVELVHFSLADAARLAALGWKSTLATTSQTPTSESTLNAGQNATFEVLLNATSTIFIAPGTVTVSASVGNASGAVQATATLAVPLGSVHPSTPPGGSPLIVTGPSLTGAPPSYPDWLVPVLVFVPAIALAVGLLARRWWRTRRWTRR